MLIRSLAKVIIASINKSFYVNVLVITYASVELLAVMVVKFWDTARSV